MSSEKLGSIDITMSLETSDFKKSVNEVTQDSKELRKDFRVLDAELKNVERTEEGLAQAGRKLSSVLDRQKSYVKQLENAQERLTREGKQGTTAFNRLGDNLRNARVDLERTKTAMHRLNTETHKLSGSAGDSSSKMDKLEGILGDVGISAVTTAGLITGAVEMMKHATEVSAEYSDAQQNLETKLGATGDELKKYEKVMSDMSVDGMTKSLEESADVIVALKQNLGDMSDKDMKKFGEQTVAVSHVLGSEFNETLAMSKRLTQAFGTDTETTFDDIVVAVQNGVNAHGDLLDTINEYSTYFKDAGFTQGEFFAILDQGLKNGIRNTDLVADGVKEFQIALNDGRIEKGIKNWDTGTQNVFKKYQEGKATAKDVFDSVVGYINNAKTTEEKLQAVKDLGITQFEDYGTKGFENMDKIDQKAKDTKGSVEKITNVEKKHASGWSRLMAVSNKNFWIPMGKQLDSWAGKFADMLEKEQQATDKMSASWGGRSYATTPSKSYKGGHTTNPYSNVGKNSTYQITQNIYTNGGTEKGVNQANKKIQRNMGKSY